MKKLCVLLAFLTIIMNAINVHGEVVNHSDDFVYKKNYSFSVAKLNSITYGNNMFVAVGNNGAIKISANGINWDGIKPLDRDIHLTKVIWNGSIFVAIGGSGRIITSNNGRDWTLRDFGSTEDIFDITWDGKQFIGLSCQYRLNQWAIPVPIKSWLLKSKDGLTWSRSIIEFGERVLLENIIYTGKEYIINSKYYSSDAENWINKENNGTVYNCSTKSTQLLKINQSEVSTSINGEEWTYKGKSEIPDDNFFKKILWNGKVYVGIDNYGNRGIMTSDDGVSWIDSIKEDITDLCWNGKVFVAIGKDTNVLYSSDGLKWNKSYSGMKEYLNDIVYNGKKYVAVGGQGGSSDWDYGMTISSIDGLKWEVNKKPIDDCLISVIWDGKKFVAVGGKSIYFSNDAINWSKASTQKCSFKDIIWNGKIYVAPVCDAGISSMIAYSKDGKKWTIVKIGDYGQLNSIAWNGSKFLSISEDKAYVSKDGVKWSVNELNFRVNSNLCLKCVDTNFITSGCISKDGSMWSEGVFISKDGINWSEYKPDKLGKYDSNTIIRTVEGKYIKGYNLRDKQYISPDGYNWLVLNLQEYIYSIAYNSKSGRFVAVGPEGTVIVADSKNPKRTFENTGIVWDKYENAKYGFNSIQLKPEMVSDDYDRRKDNINSIAFSGDTYVAVGDNGIIRTSSDSVKWTNAMADTKSNLNYVLWNASKFIAVGDKGTVLESADGRD